MEAVVLLNVGFSEYFCPKQGQDFKPSAAPLYPNMGQVPPALPPPGGCRNTHVAINFFLAEIQFRPWAPGYNRCNLSFRFMVNYFL